MSEALSTWLADVDDGSKEDSDQFEETLSCNSSLVDGEEIRRCSFDAVRETPGRSLADGEEIRRCSFDAVGETTGRSLVDGEEIRRCSFDTVRETPGRSLARDKLSASNVGASTSRLVIEALDLRFFASCKWKKDLIVPRSDCLVDFSIERPPASGFRRFFFRGILVCSFFI
jgi:hypothetical protein